MAYVQSQSLAWFDHYLAGAPNGIDNSKPVTIAAATGSRKVSYAALPKTKVVPVGFRGTTLNRTGASFLQPVETFGVSLLKVQVKKVSNYPRLVATVKAGNKVITHGAIVPKVGLQTIRLANYVQYIPKGTKLSVTFQVGAGRLRLSGVRRHRLDLARRCRSRASGPDEARHSVTASKGDYMRKSIRLAFFACAAFSALAFAGTALASSRRSSSSRRRREARGSASWRTRATTRPPR